MKNTILMTHIVAGYPNMEESEKIAIAMAESGVGYIEIQFPFSDPIADGSTIRHANQVSLENGTTIDQCLELLARLKKKIKIPILIMTYYNIPFNYGLENFCKKASDIGCFGLIIPDIPIDEEPYEHYLKLCEKYNINPIQIISSISPIERLIKINKIAKGFVYAVSHAGTTGERKDLDQKIFKYLEKVKGYIHVPIAVGFGISTKEQVDQLTGKADIIVIGSKILNIYNESVEGEKIENIKRFLKGLIVPY